jgi:hypothetical protein
LLPKMLGVAGRFHLVGGPFGRRFAYVTPVLLTKLMMETAPGLDE